MNNEVKAGFSSLKSVTPWQERSGMLGLSPTAAWVLLAQIIFSVQFLLVLFGNGTRDGLPAFAVYSLMIAYAGLIPVYTARRMKSVLPTLTHFVDVPPDDLERWSFTEMKKLFSFKRDLLSFMLIGIPITTVLLHVTETFQLNRPWFAVSYADRFAAFAFLVWCMAICHFPTFILGLFGFVRRLSALPIRPSYFQDPKCSLYGLGRLLIAVAAHFMGLVTLAYFGIWLSPLPVNWMVLIVMGLAVTCTISIFAVPQLRIHNLMLAQKHLRLNALSVHLDKTMRAVLEAPSLENVQEFERLESVRHKLKELDEWPFDIKLIVQLIASTVVPIALMLVDSILRKP